MDRQWVIETATVTERDLFGDVDENPETNSSRVEALAELAANDIDEHGWPSWCGAHETADAANQALGEMSEGFSTWYGDWDESEGTGWFGVTETVTLSMRDGYQATYARIRTETSD